MTDSEVVLCKICKSEYLAKPRSPLHTRKICTGCNKARIEKSLNKTGGEKMIKTKPISRFEYDKLNKRMVKMSGYNQKMKGYEVKLQKILDSQRIIRNEIKTLHHRIDRLRQRFRSNDR